MNLELYLGVLKEGLKLWNSKEGSKYLDEVIDLEKKYNEEMAKHIDERSDYVIDSCLLKLRVIGQSFQQYPGKNRNS